MTLYEKRKRKRHPDERLSPATWIVFFSILHFNAIPPTYFALHDDLNITFHHEIGWLCIFVYPVLWIVLTELLYRWDWMPAPQGAGAALGHALLWFCVAGICTLLVLRIGLVFFHLTILLFPAWWLILIAAIIVKLDNTVHPSTIRQATVAFIVIAIPISGAAALALWMNPNL